MRASIASHISWAQTPDRAARTAAARKALLDRFDRDARERYPDADDVTIARIAGSLRSAYFKELAYKSSIARSRRAQAAT